MRQCTCCTLSLGRRSFLAGAAALAATGVRADENPRRIDVHHHIVPPSWLDALKRAKLDNPPLTSWTPQRSIEDMDKAGTATAITSPTSPQVGFLPAPDAARVAREANEYAKQLMADHPGRFGVFAMLPMPYIDECLKEIEYAFDTLEGRRHRHDDQLRRQVARLSAVRAGVRRAEPPQGDGLYPPDDAPTAASTWCRA